MAATLQSNAITLKGSTEMVAEFFGKYKVCVVPFDIYIVFCLTGGFVFV